MDKTGIAEMLRKLTEADGPSGSEDVVAEVVRSLAQEYAPDLRIDALGSVIARPRRRRCAAGTQHHVGRAHG